MKQEQIERINELARKSKTTGLTPEEKKNKKNYVQNILHLSV